MYVVIYYLANETAEGFWTGSSHVFAYTTPLPNNDQLSKTMRACTAMFRKISSTRYNNILWHSMVGDFQKCFFLVEEHMYPVIRIAKSTRISQKPEHENPCLTKRNKTRTQRTIILRHHCRTSANLTTVCVQSLCFG